MRPHILTALLLCACSSGGYRAPTAAPSTFTAGSIPPNPRDAAGQPVPDLASALPDLQPQPVADLASSPPDLGSQPDLAAPPPDLATVPADMTPADMTPPPGCFVKLAPATALPQRFTEGTWRWELGEIPRPELGADVVLQFTRVDKWFYRYRVVLGDASCAPGCPTWVHESYGPGSYNYRFHSTSGWRRPVLTIEVPNDATLDLKAVELTVPCR